MKGEGGVELGLAGPRWEGTKSPVAAGSREVNKQDRPEGTPKTDAPRSAAQCSEGQLVLCVYSAFQKLLSQTGSCGPHL